MFVCYFKSSFEYEVTVQYILHAEVFPKGCIAVFLYVIIGQSLCADRLIKVHNSSDNERDTVVLRYHFLVWITLDLSRSV